MFQTSHQHGSWVCPRAWTTPRQEQDSTQHHCMHLSDRVPFARDRGGGVHTTCSEAVRSCYWSFLVTRWLYGTAWTIKINNKESIQICSSVLAFHLLIAVLASLDSKYFLLLFLILHIYQFQSQQPVMRLTSVGHPSRTVAEAFFMFALTAEVCQRASWFSICITGKKLGILTN